MYSCVTYMNDHTSSNRNVYNMNPTTLIPHKTIHSYVWHDPSTWMSHITQIVVHTCERLFHICDMTLSVGKDSTRIRCSPKLPGNFWTLFLNYLPGSFGPRLTTWQVVGKKAFLDFGFSYLAAYLAYRFNLLNTFICTKQIISYVQYDSFVCVNWLIHTCDIIHSWEMILIYWWVWHDSFICVTWFVYNPHPSTMIWHDMTHDHTQSCVYDDMSDHHTQSCVWHDSFTRAKWLTIIVHTWLCVIMCTMIWHDMSHTWLCVIMCVTWLIHMCEITQLCVTWLILCAKWLLLMIGSRHTYEWVTSHIRLSHVHMNDSCHIEQGTFSKG